MKKIFFLSALMLMIIVAMMQQRVNAQVPVWDGTWIIWTHGSGTQADPYLIETPQHLAWLAKQVNNGVSTYNGVYFRLTTDLDMNSMEWSPIGNSTTNRFKGSFNGDGHYIDNIYILITANENKTYCGLFGVVDGATINDLGVNTTITSQGSNTSTYAGGLIGYIYSGNNSINNCYNNGTVGNSSYMGGLIGYINSITILTGCNNMANVGVSGSSAYYSGGLVGCLTANTTITNCHNSGNVLAYYGSGSGGIVGIVTAATTITNCSNKGVVRTTGSWSHFSGDCGGLIGYCNTTGTVSINTSHNEGNVSGTKAAGLNEGVFSGSQIGGLVGYSNSSLNITNCYNIGTITSAACMGGLVGYAANSISLENCFNKGNMNVTNITSTLYGGGLIGYNKAAASLVHSFNIGNVTLSTSSYFNNTGNSATAGYIYPSAFSGGIVGVSNNPILIEQCYNTGSISASTNHNKNSCLAGGISGSVGSTGNSIKECYNTGTVSGRTCGGIAGSMSGSISNCYNVGSLGGTNPKGIADVTSNNCYYLNTCGGGSNTGSTSLTAIQMQTVSFPGMLNSGVQGTPAYIMDMTPNINQGYPIFGEMIYAITQSATSVGATKATLNGVYSGSAELVGFQYRTNTTSSEWNTVYTNIGSPVVFQLNGLLSSTSYVFRIIVKKNNGIFLGEEKTFTTGTCNLTANVTPSSVTICEGETVSLTASAQSVFSNLFSYNWNTGETSSTVSVLSGGEHSVTVSDTNGCTAIASVNVTVNPSPSVAISGSTSLCAGENGQLTVLGGGTYIWSTGATTQSITISQGGNYSVTATNSYGCSASQSVTVTTSGTPIITGSTAFCPGGYTTLTATGGDNYVWSNGSNTASIIVNTVGTYTVTASTTDGCIGETSIIVTQNPTPVVQISGNTVICTGVSTALTASSNASYAWSNGETGQSITAYNPGNYSVTVTNVYGCSNSATVNVTTMGTVNISGNTHICSGQSTTLTVNETGSYAWSNGSSASVVTVTEPGNYSVTVSLPNGCFSSSMVHVTVGNTPTPSISGNASICQGQTTTLTANGGNSYLWSNGNTNNSINVSQSGIYSVTATSLEGCTGSTNVTVTVHPMPNVNISGFNSFCQGGSITLTANGANSYTWSNGSSTATTTVINPGVYIVLGTDVNGCSATASKTVSVNPSYNIQQTHSICQGEIYNFNGQYLNTAGTYTQSLSTINGCDSTIILTLTVKNLPTPSIIGNTTFCQGQSTTLTANGGESYVWSNGSTNPNVTVFQNGVYTVTATNADGCSATANVTVTVNPLPNMNIIGNSSFCQGGNISLTATGASTYEWSNSQTSNMITVNNAGAYTVTGTGANGCTNTATKTVYVNPTYNIPLTHSICQGESYNFYGQNLTTAGTYTKTFSTVDGCDSVLTLTLIVKALPTVSIAGITSICQGQTTTLTANGGNTYLWSNGSTTSSINVTQSGIYTVTATNAEGCSAITNVTVAVNPLPNVIIAGNSSFCRGYNTTLTVSGAGTYVWNNSSTVESITVSSAGTYTVTGTDANNCTNTATKTVSVNPTYNIQLTHSICEGESYNFYGQNLTTAGTYTHTLQTVNGCDSVLTLTLTLKALPMPSITGYASICQGQTATLTANGGTSYEWSNGSTTSSINVAQSGVYTVTATNAEGCSATTNFTVSVNPLPNVIIIGNSSFCQGDNTMLTATGAGTYVWNNSSMVESISVSSAGTYTVTGTNVNGCSNTATKTVTVNPTYNVALTHSMCEGESYNFYGQNIISAGTYTHTLQTINGCDSVLTLVVTMKALPPTAITGNTSLCEGETTTLTANGGSSYVWSDGSSNNTISVSQSGVYTVTATNTEGCSNTANVTVTVNPLPNVSISGNNSFCQGDNVTLTAMGASSYAWSNASTNASITVNNAGTYTVTGTDGNGCSNTATKAVSVNPTYNTPLTHSMCEGESYNFYGQNITTAGTYTHTLQTVNGCDSVLTLTVTLKALPPTAITGNTTLCEGESTTLVATGGVSYAWSNGGTSNSTTVNQSGVYTVIATNAEGCSATANVTVTVNPLPTITIGGNTTICAGSSTTLTASGANSYSWSTGDNTASVTFNAFGIYTVTGTSAEGCSNMATVTVLVSQLPVVTITGETDICAGESTTLTANGGETYLWSDGTTSNSLTVNMAGTYQVIGYNAAGCNAMASATVNVWQPATSEFSIVTEEPCYSWNNIDYCESGDYTQTLQTVHGCDSVVTLHLTITVGIDDHDLGASMTVYPNPTNDIVNVQITNHNSPITQIHVFDAYGKLVGVVETRCTTSLQTAQIDLSRYAPGVYFVKAVADDKVVAVRKVVKR